MNRMALYMQDKHNLHYELEMAKYAEERGFSEIWQADTRLATRLHRNDECVFVQHPASSHWFSSSAHLVT